MRAHAIFAVPISLLLLCSSDVPATASVRAAEPDAAEPGAWRWREVASPLAGGGVSAVAFDARSERLALGGASGGVAIRRGRAGGFERVRTRGAVRALRFGAAGALWIASEGELARLLPGAATPLPQVLAPGEGARSINDIATDKGWVAVATAAGVFVARELPEHRALHWRAASDVMPRGPAATVAISALSSVRARVWAVAGNEVWTAIASLRDDHGEIVLEAAREVVVGPEQARQPVLALRMLGGALVALYADRFAVAEIDSLPSGSGEMGWQVLRPQLPAGASLRDLAFAPESGTYWLATDRGTLVAAELAGTWRRAAPPAGTRPGSEIAAGAGQVVVASERGALAGERRTTAANAGPTSALGPLEDAARARRMRGLEAQLAREPGIRGVQREALAHQQLEARDFAALRRGLARRAWWPDVDLDVGYARARDWSIDRDQSFVSGDTRFLVDRDRANARDVDAGLSLSWELDRFAFDPDAITISREQRLVIALRDDVLDELAQLYFERQRVLYRAASHPEPASLEALELRLRARELLAAIDAWTGGWFAPRCDAQP